MEFDLEGEDLFLKTKLAQLWHPDLTEMTFVPKQFHFHMGKGHKGHGKKDKGSEHTLDGNHLDMEMHIVCLNLDASTKDKFLAAVVGVLFKINREATQPNFADKFFAKLFDSERPLIDFQREFVDHLDFNNRFVYRGSLTTPPYSESLLWTVLLDTIDISPETAELFKLDETENAKNARKYEDPISREPIQPHQVGAQNREVQKTNGRQVFKLEGAHAEEA
uniref:carbonic anhydrase n=1 Tax=Strombidium rassoulzadegani TaxID=1082188 RepID=A0A7S3FVH0_9SPIT|mmetsp:Transcript_18462/g.31595  ORF Transcript_18462/g.31595 Transcript_18462/m.31595 type:complete len:221 (+) Transcript_18462:240-902(+)